jgi:curved DNA-binding protein CbpA
MTDPYLLLGVPADADDASIRAAYLVALRACPPERDARRFEQIRAAYEAIGTATARLEHDLFNTAAPTAADLLQACAADWQPGLPSESGLLQVLGGGRA